MALTSAEFMAAFESAFDEIDRLTRHRIHDVVSYDSQFRNKAEIYEEIGKYMRSRLRLAELAVYQCIADGERIKE